MQFLTSTLLLATLSSLALAQTTANPLTACAAADVVTLCLSTTDIAVKNCPVQDYTCLCAAYQAQATCYNNCPNDQRAPSAQQQVVANCNAASQISVQNAATATTSSIATRSATTTLASVTATTTGGSGTSSGAVATATKANAGVAAVRGGAGAGLVGVAALVAALL